jgi:hypothetical protein
MQHQQILELVRDNPQAVERAREQMGSVMARSATDMEFRQQLLSDSSSALSQHFGREITGNANISFVESAPGTATLVLPDIMGAAGELNEAELEAVSGGLLHTAALVVVCVAYYWMGDQMNN